MRLFFEVESGVGKGARKFVKNVKKKTFVKVYIYNKKGEVVVL